VTSGIVDTCDGFVFPSCPEWRVNPDAINYKYDITVNLTQNNEENDLIYTAISGWHTPYYPADDL